MFLILCGRSGSGKSTIEKMLEERQHFQRAVSYTSRSPRKDEVEGVNYHFTDRETIQSLYDKNKLIEINEYQGNLYGIGIPDIYANTTAVIEYNGILQLQKHMKKLEMEPPIIIYLDASYDTVVSRIPDRQDRIHKDSYIFNLERYSPISNVIIDANQDIESVYNDVLSYIEACNKAKEWTDVVDSDGIVLRTVPRIKDFHETLNKDELFKCVEVIIYNSKEEKFLITKRSSTKSSYPNLWEVTSGGTRSGESQRAAAIRELKEETRYNAWLFDLQHLGTRIATISHVYKDTYLLEVPICFEVPISSEVSDYKWVTLDELHTFVSEKNFLCYQMHIMTYIYEYLRSCNKEK